MNLWTYSARGLRYYGRSHLALLLGATIASAVLTGALWVGDSVRFSLRRMALSRLGEVRYALSSQDRLFRADLASRLRDGSPGTLTSVLRLNGVVSAADGSVRVNAVQVLGVEDDFWKLAPDPQGARQEPAATNSAGVSVNERLAAQLGLKVGQQVLVRIAKPSPLSREAPISPQEDTTSAQRFTVDRILTTAALGNLNLIASQIPPFNLTMPLSALQKLAEAPGQANLLLSAGQPGAPEPKLAQPDEGLRHLQGLVSNRWSLADGQLELSVSASNRALELRTSRVFLDDFVAQAAMRAEKQTAGILTYFVNELRVGDRATPYSTVCATDASWLPPDLKEDEIMVTSWLAEDLELAPGATLALKYFVVGDRRNLEEKTATFRVKGILPARGPWDDPRLMPDFPGLSQAENCRDWDAGFAIELDKIRPKDQTYWDEHRGTPKAFITLEAGQRLWSSRFGSLTAVRYQRTDLASVSNALRRVIDPTRFGLAFEPVRAEAIAASEQGQDFGQLFLGFSFFVLVAALILTVMMFHFSIEQRASEIGLLLAVGVPPRRIQRLLLTEGALVALAGAALGYWLGDSYASLMIRGLTTIWRDAVNTGALVYHGTFLSGVMGVCITFLLSLATLWRAARRQVRRPAHWLMTAGREFGESDPARGAHSRWPGGIAVACGVGALGALGTGLALPAQASPMFFLAGACLVTTCLLMFSLALRGTSHRQVQPSFLAMGVKNLTRRRRRSVSVAAMLALGTFIVVAVGVNRLDAGRDATARKSGTGGFALLAQSALPLVHDLNSRAGREFLNLDTNTLRDTRAVAFRVHDGDDASCLNLNRAQRPRLLGVDPRQLAQRHAFAFTDHPETLADPDAWLALDQVERDGAVPAIGDAASIQWALGKSVGDTLTLADENGKPFKVRLVGAVANSILQGSLIISEKSFLGRFPSETGSRWFLFDVPAAQVATVSAQLNRALQDYGFETSRTTERLAQLNAVQNTYISTFQVLGGLGLLIGTVGMGLVVARNVLERRHELAILHALGYRDRQIRSLILWEHALLFLVGAGIGLFCALVAIVPSFGSGGAPPSYLTLGLILGSVLASGLIWTWLATRVALRQDWLTALRSD